MTGLLRPVTEVTLSAAFVFGMVLALLGSLKLSLAKTLNLGEGRVGALLSAFNLALLPMMLLSGVLIDLHGAQLVLMISAGATALGLFALSTRPNVTGAFGAILLTGLGAAGLSTASIVLMPAAFFGRGEPLASLNLGNVFVALGALLTPALTDVLLRWLGVRRAIGLLALICLVPGVLAAFAGADALQTGGGKPDLAALFSVSTLWLAGLVFLLYAPLEASISIWATTYLTDPGHGERRATWLLSGFWTTFLLSRLAAAALQHGGYIRPGWDSWLLVPPALLAAVVLGNLIGTNNPNAAWRGLLLLGFLLGPIFPTLVGMLFQQLDNQDLHAHGTAYGLLFAAGSVGSFILAPLMGSTARRQSVQAALRIPLFVALLLTAATLVFWLAA